MKTWKVGSVLAAIVVAGLAIAGCTQQQVQAVAQQAGIASIVTWISVDNPTDAQKATVSGIVDVIKTNAAQVVQGGSYYSALVPVVSTYIDKYVPVQSKPIATLASGWVLTGIDTFFAMYPQYAGNAAQAVGVVNSFCDGAKVGLAMSRDNPVVQAATRGSEQRSKVRKALQ
jgi:hypothetical protein